MRDEDPRVVHEDVEAAEGLGRAVDHAPHRLRVGQVGADDRVAGARQGGGHRLRLVGTPPEVDRDAVALGREGVRGGGADPT